MNKKIPVYHYTTFESTLKIIESEKVRFSAAYKTNDPFEFSFIGGNFGEKDREFILKSSGIFCASLSKNNILMLSHYSKNEDGIVHGGCFLEFEFDEEKKLSGIEFINLMKPNFESGAMGYSNQVPDLRSFFRELNNLIKEKKSEVCSLEQSVLSIVGTKRKIWEYEEEVRFVVKFNDEGSKNGYGYSSFEDCGLKLKAVYYGCRCSEVDKSILTKIANSKNIEVKAAITPDFRSNE